MTALVVAALMSMTEEPVPLRGDARLSFTANDDLYARDRPSGAPGIIMTRPRRTFFDDHDELDLAYSNTAHLMMIGALPPSLFGVDGELALVGQLAVGGGGAATLRDASSYLKVWKDIDLGRLVFIAFPFGADRMRLGFSERVAWGDRTAFRDQTLVPGARFELVREDAYAHVGVKTSTSPLVQRNGTVDRDNVWGVLGGAGWEPIDLLRIELGGAYFFRGTIDRVELLPREGGNRDVSYWTTTGGSLQVTLNPVRSDRPVDFEVFERDPFVRDSFFEAPWRGHDFTASSEVTVLKQPLQNPRRPARTKDQFGVAGDLEGAVALGALNVGALFAWRNLAFVLFDVPGNSFADFPVGTRDSPELSGALSAQYGFDELGLTVMASGGLLRPAVLESITQAVVYRSVTSSTLLPRGASPRLVFEGKAGALARLSEHLACALEVLWAQDPNDSVLRSLGPLPVRERRERRELWLNLLLRGRL